MRAALVALLCLCSTAVASHTPVTATIGWTDDDSGIAAFRLYAIDSEGNATQVGDDIPAPTKQTMVAFASKGLFTFAVTAVNDNSIESNLSVPLNVKVTKRGVREVQ